MATRMNEFDPNIPQGFFASRTDVKNEYTRVSMYAGASIEIAVRACHALAGILGWPVKMNANGIELKCMPGGDDAVVFAGWKRDFQKRGEKAERARIKEAASKREDAPEMTGLRLV